MKIAYKATFLILFASMIFFGYSLRAFQDAQTSNEKVVYITIAPTPRPIDDNNLWLSLQEWRLKRGLNPYAKSDVLCKFAQTRVKQIKINYSHKGFFSLHDTQYPAWSLGENIANNWRDSTEMIRAWESSPEHLKNLQADYKYSCVATDGTYAVQIFGNF